MKKIICASIAFLVYGSAYTQTSPLPAQHFQQLHMFNPAHTGMYNFLDIVAGTRQQWTGFQGAPKMVYLSANGTLGSLKDKTSDANPPQKPVLKHGIGTSVLSDRQGPYKQSELSLMYAAHVPVSNSTYLALGASPSLYVGKLDLSDVWVKESSDPTYQSLLQNGGATTRLHVNMGMSLYSSRYYVSYGLRKAGNARFSGNEDVFHNESAMAHHILAGYRFELSTEMELLPGGFAHFDKLKPTLYGADVRARYKGNYWVGMSFRNNHTYSGMLGMTFQKNIRFAYSYEYKTADISRYNNGTHEVSVGLRLFNKTEVSPMW